MMKTKLKFLLLTISMAVSSYHGLAQTACPESVGTWAFASGPTFELKKEGTIFQDNVVKGSWTCDPETAILRMTWKTGSVNQYLVTEAGNVLYTELDGGYEIVAQMISTTKKEGPSDLMDKSKGTTTSDQKDLGNTSQKPKEKEPKKGTGGGVKGN